MRSQFLQSPRLSPFGRRGGIATAAYAVSGLAPGTVADFQNAFFAAQGAPVSLGALVTFARSGAAMAPGADGYLDAFADGAIRSPSYALENGSWVQGLTLETQVRTNRIANADVSTWATQNGVVWTPGQIGVDGTPGAVRMQDIGNSTTGTVSTKTDVTTAGPARHVFSFYVKEDQASWAMAYVENFTTPGNSICYFDVGTGSPGTSPLTIGIVDVGNGFYRGYLSFMTDAADLFGKLSLWLADGNSDFSLFRNGTSSLVFDRAQFEAGALPSSHVMTTGAMATRNAESLSIAPGKWPFSASAMSGALVGAETFADEDVAAQVRLVDIRADANNRITLSLDTDGARTGTFTLTIVNGGASVSLSAAAELPPGILSGFGVAWRVTASEINLALDGVAETAVANTAGIANLSGAEVTFGGMGFRKQSLFWGDDIGDSGLEEVSAPGHFNIGVA